jgi:hypothetical protein
LFAVFPDAAIIQTHRNPMEVLKSSADLTRVLRGLYARPADAEEIRMREARVLAEGTERFIKFRDAHPELANRFVDIKYTELIADPLAAVGRIYEQLDNPLTDAARRRMRELTGQRSRYQGSRASDEGSGLSLKSPREAGRFQRYCLRFDVPFREADFQG